MSTPKVKEKNFAFQGLEKKKKLKSERWREFKIRGHQHSLATSSSTTNKPPIIIRWITENCKKKKKNSRRNWFVEKRTTLTKQNKTKKTPQWRLAPSRVSNKFYPLILQTKKKKWKKIDVIRKWREPERQKPSEISTNLISLTLQVGVWMGDDVKESRRKFWGRIQGVG